MVFFSNANILQTLKLLGLDSLNLQALVLKPLANLATLFEIVKALLLLSLDVDTNLVTIHKKNECSVTHLTLNGGKNSNI